MKPKGRKPQPFPGDPNDPDGMHVWVQRYLKALLVKGLSETTVSTRRKKLAVFIEWCEARSLTRPTQITKPIVEAYQRHLYHRRQANGKPLTFGSQRADLVAIRMLFQWFARSNVLLYNPASDIELPRLGRRLPRHVLTAAEVEAVLAEPDVADPLGLRDRAILEVFYSTGIRRAELAKLSIYDVDADNGTLMVREGKMSNDRMVPIGERALAWVEKYQREARGSLLTDPNLTALFISRYGQALEAHSLTSLARRYVKGANIGKTGSCHIFRHAMATLMLEHGADVRMIQAILGHASLATTAIYTHVAIRQLKEVHDRTHPGAKLGKTKETPKTAPTSGTGALFSALADEAREEERE